MRQLRRGTRRNLSIDTRTVIESDWYRDIFPRLQLKSKRNVEFVTTLHGSRFGSGRCGAITGRGADIIIFDDPSKPQEALSAAGRRAAIEFYENTLSTRLNDKRTGAIVIVMQRLHEEDLVGYLLDKDDWVVVTLPALTR